MPLNTGFNIIPDKVRTKKILKYYNNISMSKKHYNILTI